MGKIKDFNQALLFFKMDKKGFITEVNDEFCTLSGYAKEELIGKKYEFMAHEDVKKSSLKNFWKKLGEKKPYRMIFKNQSKEGKTFYLDSIILAVLDEKEEAIAYVCFSFDISEFFALNDKFLASKKKLQKMNESFNQIALKHEKELLKYKKSFEKKMQKGFIDNEIKAREIYKQSLNSSLKEVLNKLAHQWRQPLNELAITLFKMKQNLDNEKEFEVLYQYSKQMIQDLSLSIDKFSSFAQVDKKQSVFSVLQTIKETQDSAFEILQKAGVKIHLKFQKDYEVLGFKDDLSRVLLNLFLNSIEAYGKQNVKDIFISLSEFGKKYVKMSVKDEAGGIVFLDKIFEPFFTTKNPLQGSGLDLYFSKQLIENMQGQIKVSNAKNGACFSIYLRKI